MATITKVNGATPNLLGLVPTNGKTVRNIVVNLSKENFMGVGLNSGPLGKNTVVIGNIVCIPVMVN